MQPQKYSISSHILSKSRKKDYIFNLEPSENFSTIEHIIQLT